MENCQIEHQPPDAIQGRSESNYRQRNSKEFSIEYKYENTFQQRYIGANTLYNKRKGNSYFLLDFAPNRNQWAVFTNNRAFINESTDQGDFLSYLPKETFVSRSRVPNLKFCISKFLTMFFKHQTFIPNGIRNKYYNRLRTLLINQYNAITHRLALERVKNDNKTKTFIKFSY